MTPAALRLRGLSKSFGGEQALDDVSLTVEPAEIHGLLGENGSGKSTLIKVLAGYHVPDAGELEVHGRPVPLPLAPGQFRALGLEFVHQDLGLVPSLTIVENLCVSDIAHPRRRWHISWSRQRARTRSMLERYGVDLDPTAQIAELKPVERAMIAIVRAVEGLRTGPDGDAAQGDVSKRVLILDEPTVFLPRDGTELLFGLLREVVAKGASVIFVSHKLHEALELTDRITVLRDGRLIDTVATADADEAALIRLIVGHDLQFARTTHSVGSKGSKPAVVVDGAAGGRLHETSFDVHAGEIVGITGLVGAGFEELPYLLLGAREGIRGSVQIDGVEHALGGLTPWRALRAGIALVPADRQRYGGVPSLTVEENLTLPVLGDYRRGPLLSRRAMAREARSTLADFQVNPSEPRLVYSALSGGNQQKLLLAKWLQTDPRLLVLHEPTQGVDVGAREQLHALIRAAADEGMAVICASSDHEQLALLCDRVFIVAEGNLVDELVGDRISENAIAEGSYRGVTLRTTAVPPESPVPAR